MYANLEDQLNEVINAIWNQQNLAGPQSPFREGPTLMDRVRQVQDEKIGELRSLCSTVDVQVQALNRELERLKTGLSDRQEKFEGDQRVEILKFRSEIQSKTGMEEQRIRKQVESYFKTVTKEGEKVRIDMYGSSLNTVETAQRSLEARMLVLQELEDKRQHAMSEDQQRIKRLEATVQELLNKQVKEQIPNYMDPLHATAPARGRSRPGSNRSTGQQFLSRSQNSANSERGPIGSPIPRASRKRVPGGILQPGPQWTKQLTEKSQ
eukprot:3616356-Amphidinium_carterae.1